MTRAPIATLLCAAALLLIPSPAAAVNKAPAWEISSVAAPTNFSAQDNALCGTGQLASICDHYFVTLANVGAKATAGTLTIVDTLPAGLEAKSMHVRDLATGGGNGIACNVATTTCSYPNPVAAGGTLLVELEVEVTTAAGEVTNAVTVSGGGAPPASSSEPLTMPNTVDVAPSPFGIAAFGIGPRDVAGVIETQAGAHPAALRNTLNFNTAIISSVGGAHLAHSAGRLRDALVDLPPGFIGNPTAAATCTLSQLNTPVKANIPACPAGSRVGTVVFFTEGGIESSLPAQGSATSSLYNMAPEKGYPAEFGFSVFSKAALLYANLVHTPSGYALRVSSPGIPTAIDTEGIALSFFGDPHSADGEPENAENFFTNPADCGAGPLRAGVSADPWGKDAGKWASAEAVSYPEISGCNQLEFAPTIEARPTTNLADSPAGLDFSLEVPQNEDPKGLATPPLRDATVTLPKGLLVNPSSADGLVGCPAEGPNGINVGSEEVTPQGQDLGDPEATELGAGHLGGNASPYDDGLYHTAPGHCPLASQIGTVEVTTPLLEEPLGGHLYLGTPSCAPCTEQDAKEGKLINLYIEAQGSGVIAKLAGTTAIDPQSGQLTATFKENPQLPFSELKLHVKQGSRAPLRTPATCGRYETASDLEPWSAPETLDAEPTDAFEVIAGPNGDPCAQTPAQEPNAPSLEAGAVNPSAGAFSPFVLKLTRKDGSQELKGLDATLPPGLTGRLAGIPYCTQAQIAAAAQSTGLTERQSPSCPLASQVGTVNVGAGAGPTPFYVQGHAYLAGPYKGAPLSLAIITPAVAGPFDLGTVVVRAALNVDPETARIHAVSDPIPTVLDGIALDLRSIAVNMDRPRFTLNPTSCDESLLGANTLSVLDQTAALSSRFQVGGCAALGFKPKLKINLKGDTKRGGHPALTATLSARPGDANIARAAVTLPHSEFLDQGHIRTICTRVAFAANQCPAGSVYGFAKATTPLLDQPLEGPVYLRSSSHELPDLVAALSGQVDVVLAGRVDSVRGGGIRSTFEAVPDAPVSRFTLAMKGGAKGLLENSKNLCLGPSRANVSLEAQNGKTDDFNPVLGNSCPKKAKKHHKHKH